jgi:hypothetical protein
MKFAVSFFSALLECNFLLLFLFWRRQKKETGLVTGFAINSLRTHSDNAWKKRPNLGF